eukprot:scaffold213326_cov17-Prasinocladus_malaysianus.AAC.1
MNECRSFIVTHALVASDVFRTETTVWRIIAPTSRYTDCQSQIFMRWNPGMMPGETRSTFWIPGEVNQQFGKLYKSSQLETQMLE